MLVQYTLNIMTIFTFGAFSMKTTNFFEKKKHGSTLFPLEYYFVDSSHPQYIMPAHWHSELEIIKVSKGKLTLFINNTEYLLCCGDIMFIDGGSIHRCIPFDCVYECIVFNIEMLTRHRNDITEKYINPLSEASLDLNHIISNSDGEIHSEICRLFKEVSDKKPFYELATYSLLFNIFCLLYRSEKLTDSQDKTYTSQTRKIMTVLKWLNKNFSQNVTLEKLAEISGLSEKYLCRIFKEYTSKTIINYLNELRVDNAYYEIVAKGKNVTQAALDSGFNDLSYFSKTFKKYKGISPSELR